MQSFELQTIYHHIEALKPRRIALITQRFDQQTRFEDGEEKLELNLRNRESVFTAQLQMMGIACEAIPASQLPQRLPELRKPLNYDMIVIAGEVCSQSVSIAAEIKAARVKRPLFLEIIEDEAANPSSLRAICSNAKRHNAPEVLNRLVYITKQRHTPRSVEFDIAPVETTPAADIIVEFNPTAADNAAPPRRIKSQVSRIIRDTDAAKALKRLYGFRCQLCGTTIPLPNGKSHIEVHHIQPLGGIHHGPDTNDNMLALCPNHHAMFDYLLPIFEDSRSVRIEGKLHRLTLKHDLAEGVIAYHNKIRKKQLGG